MNPRDLALYPEIRDSMIALARLCRPNNTGDTRYIDGLIIVEAVFAQRNSVVFDVTRRQQVERAIVGIATDADHAEDLVIGGRVMAAIYLLDVKILDFSLRDKVVQALHNSQQDYYAGLLAQRT